VCIYLLDDIFLHFMYYMVSNIKINMFHSTKFRLPEMESVTDLINYSFMQVYELLH
jgi:hypothetical protein